MTINANKLIESFLSPISDKRCALFILSAAKAEKSEENINALIQSPSWPLAAAKAREIIAKIEENKQNKQQNNTSPF